LIHGFLVTGTADRRILLVLWPALFFLLLTLRTVARWAARVSTPPERCLVIGEWQTSDWLEQTFSNRRRFHAGVVARVDSAQFGGTDPADGELLFEDLRELVSSLRVDRVVVTSGKADAESAITAIRLTSALGVKVSVLPRILEVVGSAVEFDDVDGLPLLSTHFARFSRSSQILKRAVDLSGSIGLLVLLSPLFLLIAVAVKLDSDGPVLFSQDRIGRQGRRFRMLKFRTMVAEADSQKADLLHLNEARGLFKIANDPRCTRVGRLLRRTSLDELPQLLNVVRNEMSLVGPRPLVADEDERVEGWHRRRLQLTPGMTGHWQILGSARIPLEDMLRIDYLYVTNWSLWLDVKILLRTIPYVLTRQGL
jgi:exopolysaccharide biosynthesis polyprenyl glycosylphosphotransferase